MDHLVSNNINCRKAVYVLHNNIYIIQQYNLFKENPANADTQSRRVLVVESILLKKTKKLAKEKKEKREKN